MEKIITIIIVFVTGFLSAQTYQTIESIEEKGESEYGVYYKDVNNVFNTFEGTYEYDGSNFYFKMVLQKKVCVNISDYFWRDMIIGKYQFIKDGVDVSFLSDNLNNIDDADANVNFSSIRDSEPIFCPDCLPDKWLIGSIFDPDPTKERSASIYMAKKIQNGEEGIYVWFHYEVRAQRYDEPDPLPPHLPSGKFFMKKITD